MRDPSFEAKRRREIINKLIDNVFNNPNDTESRENILGMMKNPDALDVDDLKKESIDLINSSTPELDLILFL